jgi:hypothetical protein|tara:strand:- start:127 stop:534 length:408 start_codon:yes stop_codon:yes gene_type:complete
MPNHCYNRIEINGEGASKIASAIKSEETPFDFEKIFPEPNYDEVEVLPTFPEIVGNNDPVKKEESWWDWRVQNWGTKWNSYNCDIEDESKDYVEYTFNTAWSPPEGVIAKLREQYPDVHISAFYNEPEMEIGGYY